MNPTRMRQPSGLVLAVLMAALVFSGCSFKLVSSYDENTDKSVTALQKDFEDLFAELDAQAGLAQCAYKHHKDFYSDAKKKISSIEVRARAIPKNELTVKQLELLENSRQTLMKLHQLSCLTPEQVQAARSSINSNITAILALELAKKRGDKS